MTVEISDIVNLFEASKALKCNTFMWRYDTICNISNRSTSIIKILYLDPSKVKTYSYHGIVLNQRELSTFVKNISIESSFEFSDTPGQYYIETMNNTRLSYVIDDPYYNSSYDVNKNSIADIDYGMDLDGCKEDNVTNEMQDLFGMNMNSGIQKFNHNNHIMILFGGIIPLNKNDSIFLTIIDSSYNTFVSRFRIHKKSYDILVYIKFLNLV